jgi:hypothetical protein
MMIFMLIPLALLGWAWTLTTAASQHAVIAILLGAGIAGLLLLRPRKRVCVQCGTKVLARSNAGRCAECLNTQARGLEGQARILDYHRKMQRPYKDKK